MKTLTDTPSIRAHVAKVLDPGNGTRIVIVAFVGIDALKFIPAPKGVRIYCWPNTAATNPNGLQDLLNADAQIWFLERLHMKLFWSERGGFVIGSINLSANALDDLKPSNLREIAIYSPEAAAIDAFQIEANLRKAGAKRVTQEILEEFASRYSPHRPGNEGRAEDQTPTGKLQSFNTYLTQTSKWPWSFAAWTGRGEYKPSQLKAAADTIQSEAHRYVTPRPTLINDSIEVTDDSIAERRWLLAFHANRNGTIGKMAWLYPHKLHLLKSGGVTRSAMELKYLTVATRTPFDLASSDFRKRFENFVKDQFERVEKAEGTFNAERFCRFERLAARPSR